MVIKERKMDSTVEENNKFNNVKFEDLKIIKNLINDVEDVNEIEGFLRLQDTTNKATILVGGKSKLRKISDKYRKISNSDTLINNFYVNTNLIPRNNHRSSFTTINNHLLNNTYVYNDNKNKTRSLQNMFKSVDSLCLDYVFGNRTDCDDNVDGIDSIKSNNCREINKRKRRSSSNNKQKVKYSSVNVDDVQNAAKKHQEKVKNNVKQVTISQFSTNLHPS